MGDTKFVRFDNLSLQDINEESELIPLLTPEDEEEMNNEALPETLPILPLRNTVLCQPSFKETKDSVQIPSITYRSSLSWLTSSQPGLLHFVCRFACPATSPANGVHRGAGDAGGVVVWAEHAAGPV